MASGGDVFADLSLAGTARETPAPRSGKTGTLYGAPLHAACLWRYGGEVPPAIVDAACAEGLSGATETCSSYSSTSRPTGSRRIPTGFRLSIPGGFGAIWKSLVGHGMTPEAAVARVLPHPNEHGHRSLHIVIQYRRSLEAPTRMALLAMLS